MELDIKTILLMQSLVCFFQGGALFLLYQMKDMRFPYLQKWYRGFLLLALGLLFISLRDYIPNYISFHLANALILYGVFIVYNGLLNFVGRNIRMIWTHVFVIVFMGFYAIHLDDYVNRMIFVLGGIVLWSGYCLLFFVKHAPFGIKLRNTLTLLFAVFPLLSLFRVITAGIYHADTEFTESGNLLATVMLIHLISFITFFVGVFLLLHKRINRRWEEAVQEKDDLIRDVHHRIKNNLNYINYILYIKRNRSSNKEVESVLLDCENRVNTIALIHKKLYEAVDLKNINSKQLLGELVEDIQSYFETEEFSLKVKLDVDAFSTETKLMLPISMIVNELLTNSVKHAGREGRDELQSSISLKQIDDDFKLSVKDDGQGFSEEVLAGKNLGMGIELLKSIARQLSADLNMYNENGAVVTLKFASDQIMT